MFPLSKYLKYGLLSDDLLKENDIVREALRRLPSEVFQERQYRLTRAINLSSGKSVLPESEWTKPEEVSKKKLKNYRISKSIKGCFVSKTIY